MADKKYFLRSIEGDERHKVPSFKQRVNLPWVIYGDNNDYGDYLLDLFNRSSTHNALVTGKTNYIKGKGFAPNPSGLDTAQQAQLVKMIDSCNRTGQSLNDVLERSALDLEVFNGFALQVVWNPLTHKVSEIFPMDWTSLRINDDATIIYHSRMWTYQQSIRMNYFAGPFSRPVDLQEFRPFNPRNPVGTQIFYYRGYRPQMKAYPLPDYIGANTAIETDIEISNFHLNNVKTGFSAGTMINFYNGMPESIEEQKQLEKDIKNKATGTDNGGQLLLNFAADKDHGAEVLQLRSNELDKQYEQLHKNVIQNIFVGHRINNPMLFGIQTEGKLGGRTELIEAYEQFQNTYVNGKQQLLENEFGYLLKYAGFDNPNPVLITRTEPIQFGIDNAAIVSVMTRDEIRDKVGLPVINTESDSKIDQAVINAQASLKGTVGGVTGIIEIAIAVKENRMSSAAAIEVLVQLYGFDLEAANRIANVPTLPSPAAQPRVFAKDSDDELIELLSQLGREADDQEGEEVHFTSDEDCEASERQKFDDTAGMTPIEDDFLKGLYKIVSKGEAHSVAELAKSLKVTDEKILKGLNILQEKNYINYKTDEKGGKIMVQPIGPPNKTIIEPQTGYKLNITYKYFGPKDEKNRPFCAKMLAMNKEFTRQEIKSVSSKLGYDVWLKRGGWYTDPDTNVARPSCRHTWRQIVRKEAING